MGKSRYARIFVSLKDAMLALRYKELVHFLSKLSTPYFEGVNIFSKDGWDEVVSCVKDNYVKYDLNKEISYKKLRENIADAVEKNYNRKKYAYEAMSLVVESFNEGSSNFRLDKLLEDFKNLED